MTAPTTPRVHDPESASIHDAMAEQLRHAPWLLLSVLVHSIAVLLIMLIPAAPRAQQVAAVTMQPPPEDEILPPEKEPEEKPRDEEPVEEPILQEPEMLEDKPSEDVSENLPDDWDTDLEVSSWTTPTIGLLGRPSGLPGRRRGGHERLRKGHHATVVAIERGLNWLRRHQDEDGRWDADGFMKHDLTGEHCDGPGNAVHDVGLTGLALLAFLGDGSNLRSGPDRDVVKKAVRWLRDQQDETGLFGSATSHDFIYDHAIAALAMVEAYGLSDATVLRRNAQAGINYLESHRNPYMVWRYQPRDLDNDTSVTGWCLMVYKTGRDFGLLVNDQAVKQGETWLDQVTDPLTGRCGYTKRGEPSSRHRGEHGLRFPPDKGEALTAVGLLSRCLLGQDPRAVPVMVRAADTILDTPPIWDENAGSIDHYYWYHASYALYQMGGRHWKAWCAKLTDAVVKTQRPDGSYRGSWDPAGAWGEDGGRVYSTAILVLTLEAYYRYTRVLVR